MNRTILWIIAFISFSNLLHGQVTFESNGQQINRAVGRDVVLGDFNSDSTLDAFVVNEADYRVYFGDGRGRFTDSGQRLSRAASGGGKPAVFDLNGDGRVEVITSSTVWLINDQGRFSAQSLSIESSENLNLGTMAFADLNGDGSLDLFALRSYMASRVYLNDGHGAFHDTGQRLGDGTIGTGQLAQIALGDINGDGSTDAITAGWRWSVSTQCPNHIWLNDGLGNFRDSGQLLDEGDSHVHGLTLVDLNGDDRLDLVMSIQDSTRSGRIYLNDGTGRFIGGPNLGGAGGEDVALADFDNNGTLDLFMAHSTPPCRVWLNNGNGTLRDSGVRLGSNCTWGVAAGDINGDGRPDAFTANCIWGNSGLSPAPAQIWLNTTPISDPNGPIENQTSGKHYSVIQYAIHSAEPGDTIVMEPGIYNESIVLDRNLTIQSLDPDDTYYIGGTIIQGQADEPVVTLSGNSEACQLSGLTIRTGLVGIAGAATDATIRNCRIMDNLTHGVELSDESNPHLKHCLITGNGETGITMSTNPGRPPKTCKPIIENCIIVDNGQGDIVGGEPTIIDSLVLN